MFASALCSTWSPTLSSFSSSVIGASERDDEHTALVRPDRVAREDNGGGIGILDDGRPGQLHARLQLLATVGRAAHRTRFFEPDQPVAGLFHRVGRRQDARWFVFS